MKIFNIFALSAAVFAQSEGDYDGDYGPDGYPAPMAGLKSSSKSKKTVFIYPRKKTLNKIANHTINLARQEGLEAHALSVEIRKIKP